jgi:hypothetical protein
VTRDGLSAKYNVSGHTLFNVKVYMFGLSVGTKVPDSANCTNSKFIDAVGSKVISSIGAVSSGSSGGGSGSGSGAGVGIGSGVGVGSGCGMGSV